MNKLSLLLKLSPAIKLVLRPSLVVGVGERRSSELGDGSGAERAFAKACRSSSERKSWSKSGRREES